MACPAGSGQQAQVFRDEDLFLEEVARNAMTGFTMGPVLAGRRCSREPKALQRRVLRFWLEQTRGHLRGIDFVHIEALLRLSEEDRRRALVDSRRMGVDHADMKSFRLERRSRGLKPSLLQLPLRSRYQVAH